MSINLFITNERNAKISSFDFSEKMVKWREFDEDYAIQFLSSSIYVEKYKLTADEKFTLFRQLRKQVVSDYGCHVKFVLSVVVQKKNSWVRFGNLVVNEQSFSTIRTRNDYTNYDLTQKMTNLKIDDYRTIASIISNDDSYKNVEDLHFGNEQETQKVLKKK